MEGKEGSNLPKNEIRVQGNTGIAKYLKYAHKVLVEDETKSDTIVIRGAGQAMSNVVPLAELIRRRIKGLH